MMKLILMQSSPFFCCSLSVCSALDSDILLSMHKHSIRVYFWVAKWGFVFKIWKDLGLPFLGYHETYVGSCVQTTSPLNVGPIDRLEESVTNFQHTSRRKSEISCFGLFLSVWIIFCSMCNITVTGLEYSLSAVVQICVFRKTVRIQRKQIPMLQWKILKLNYSLAFDLCNGYNITAICGEHSTFKISAWGNNVLEECMPAA
jgi:hypothetical protein